jgi:hypothetical protein
MNRSGSSPAGDLLSRVLDSLGAHEGDVAHEGDAPADETLSEGLRRLKDSWSALNGAEREELEGRFAAAGAASAPAAPVRKRARSAPKRRKASPAKSAPTPASRKKVIARKEGIAKEPSTATVVIGTGDLKKKKKKDKKEKRDRKEKKKDRKKAREKKEKKSRRGKKHRK